MVEWREIADPLTEEWKVGFVYRYGRALWMAVSQTDQGLMLCHQYAPNMEWDVGREPWQWSPLRGSWQVRPMTKRDTAIAVKAKLREAVGV